MPGSRPASSPLLFHEHTGQYYVTRGEKRIYLGADRDEALARYHRLALGVGAKERPDQSLSSTAKELCNRFIAAQQANWRNPRETLHSYKDWLGRFLRDHPGLMAEELAVEVFAAWKVSLSSGRPW